MTRPGVQPNHAPRARKPRKLQPRAQELADGLIAQIRAGQFDLCPFPGQVKEMTEYHAGRFNVRAAFDEMEPQGWIEFRETHRGRVAVLADPLPEQHNPRLSIPVDDLDLTARMVNCQRRERIATVGELVARTDQELLDIWNFRSQVARGDQARFRRTRFGGEQANAKAGSAWHVA